MSIMDDPTMNVEDTISLLHDFHGENDTISAERAYLLVKEIEKFRDGLREALVEWSQAHGIPVTMRQDLIHRIAEKAPQPPKTERVHVDAFVLKELIHCAKAYAGQEVSRLAKRIEKDQKEAHPTCMGCRVEEANVGSECLKKITKHAMKQAREHAAKDEAAESIAKDALKVTISPSEFMRKAREAGQDMLGFRNLPEYADPPKYATEEMMREAGPSPKQMAEAHAKDEARRAETTEFQSMESEAEVAKLKAQLLEDVLSVMTPGDGDFPPAWAEEYAKAAIDFMYENGGRDDDQFHAVLAGKFYSYAKKSEDTRPYVTPEDLADVCSPEEMKRRQEAAKKKLESVRAGEPQEVKKYSTAEEPVIVVRRPFVPNIPLIRESLSKFYPDDPFLEKKPTKPDDQTKPECPECGLSRSRAGEKMLWHCMNQDCPVGRGEIILVDRNADEAKVIVPTGDDYTEAHGFLKKNPVPDGQFVEWKENIAKLVMELRTRFYEKGVEAGRLEEMRAWPPRKCARCNHDDVVPQCQACGSIAMDERGQQGPNNESWHMRPDLWVVTWEPPIKKGTTARVFYRHEDAAAFLQDSLLSTGWPMNAKLLNASERLWQDFVPKHANEFKPEDAPKTVQEAGQGTIYGTSVPVSGDECLVNPYSSRACEKGTKSCLISHPKVSAEFAPPLHSEGQTETPTYEPIDDYNWSDLWACPGCGKVVSTAKAEGEWCAEGHKPMLVSRRLRHPVPSAHYPAVVTFEEAWAKMVEKGYQYGHDALEQVRFGWELYEEYGQSPLVKRFIECASRIWSLFPHDPLGADPAHTTLERLEAILREGLLVPRDRNAYTDADIEDMQNRVNASMRRAEVAEKRLDNLIDLIPALKGLTQETVGVMMSFFGGKPGTTLGDNARVAGRMVYEIQALRAVAKAADEYRGIVTPNPRANRMSKAKVAERKLDAAFERLEETSSTWEAIRETVP